MLENNLLDFEQFDPELLMSDPRSRSHGIIDADWQRALRAWFEEQRQEYWTRVILERTNQEIAVNVHYRDLLDESAIETRVIWLIAYRHGPAADWDGWSKGEPWEGREEDIGCGVVHLHLRG